MVNMVSDCTHEEASFVSLDDLDNISILLVEDNNLEKEINHWFNEVSIFVFKLEKNILKTCTVIRGNFKLIKSQWYFYLSNSLLLV